MVFLVTSHPIREGGWTPPPAPGPSSQIHAERTGLLRPRLAVLLVPPAQILHRGRVVVHRGGDGLERSEKVGHLDGVEGGLRVLLLLHKPPLPLDEGVVRLRVAPLRRVAVEILLDRAVGCGGADVLEVGPRVARGARGDRVEVHVVAQPLVLQQHAQDVCAAPLVRQVDQQPPRETAEHSLVEILRAVGRAHHHDLVVRPHPVPPRHDLVLDLARRLVLIALPAPPQQPVDLVDEDDARRNLRREREDRLRELLALAHPLRRDRRGADREKRRAHRRGNRLRDHRLPGAGRAKQQHAFARCSQRRPREEARALQRLQHHFAHNVLHLAQRTDVVEGDVQAACRHNVAHQTCFVPVALLSSLARQGRKHRSNRAVAALALRLAAAVGGRVGARTRRFAKERNAVLDAFHEDDQKTVRGDVNRQLLVLLALLQVMRDGPRDDVLCIFGCEGRHLRSRSDSLEH
eukprot:Rhum_TRINITY_DN14364_c12_g1::Rhum_TRINITY_DN14364_c12_g1_i1::g.85562::m.85562